MSVGGQGHITEFVHKGKKYNLLVTAASVWGAGSEEPRIEFLAHYRDTASMCGFHCSLTANKQPLLKPKVSCLMSHAGTSERKGRFQAYFQQLPGKAIFRPRHEKQTLTPTVNIMCPGLQEDIDARQRFKLQLLVGKNRSQLTLELCYRQVQQVHDIVGCVEPLYGLTKSSTFFFGSPPYVGHNLLDALIVYNTRILGIPLVVYDADDSAMQTVEKYKGARVWHRRGWRIHAHGPSHKKTSEYEILAGSTCFWERRLDARWIQMLGTDTFLMPVVPRENMSVILSRLDPAQYSYALVPFYLAFSRPSTMNKSNVLQRFNLLGTPMEGGTMTYTLMNPRHSVNFAVHTPHAVMPSFNQVMPAGEVFHNMKLHMLHLMNLNRKIPSRYPERHEDPWHNELANRLQVELERIR